MAAGGIGGRWVQQGLVRHAGLHGLGEGVVDLEDGLFGAVVAVRWSRLLRFTLGKVYFVKNLLSAVALLSFCR